MVYIQNVYKNLIWNLKMHLIRQQNSEYIQLVYLLLRLVLEIILVVNIHKTIAGTITISPIYLTYI